MWTRLVVSLAFVALSGAPAYAGGDCPFGGHYTSAQTAESQDSTPQSTAPATVVEAPAEAPPATSVVDAPVVAPVTVAEAPSPSDETAQD